MGATAVERVGEVLEAALQALGLDLEAVELTPAGKRRVLRIAVDRDGGVNLDHVAEATRAVGEALDETDVMGQQPYTLEVTSRGVERPLTLERHWRRNHDRLVTVSLADGTSVTGRVSGADTEGADLDVDGTTRRVRYDEVGRALVQIEFNRRPAAVVADDLDEDLDDPDDADDSDDPDDPDDVEEDS